MGEFGQIPILDPNQILLTLSHPQESMGYWFFFFQTT